MAPLGTVLVLWNQVEDDVYERMREHGPMPLSWDSDLLVPDVGTVADEMAAMTRAMAQRYTVQVVNIEDDLDRLLAAVKVYRPDVICNLVEFFADNAVLEASVAGLLDLLGVPYTGSGPWTLATCQNKFRTKQLLEAAGLPTAAYFLTPAGQVPALYDLIFPLIVKPVLEDASGGIELASVVHNHSQLEAQVARVYREYQTPVLVEEYIDGREIHVALLGNRPPEVLPLFEMEFDEEEFGLDREWQPRIISYRAKWDPRSPEFYMMASRCPAQDLDDELAHYIRDMAVQAYDALDCRDYARIDMRLDEEDGEVYILEVNPNPDLSHGTAYMQCAEAGGRSYAETLHAILALAMERGRRRGKKRDTLPSDHLLREWVLSRTEGKRMILPMCGDDPRLVAGESVPESRRLEADKFAEPRSGHGSSRSGRQG